MKKSASSTLIASILTLTVVLSTPAIGAPTSIANGDFEVGLNLATEIDGWTVMNQRIDLGTTSIAGCPTEDTSDYSSLHEFFAEAGKEFFDATLIDTDGTYDYEIFLNEAVVLTEATVDRFPTQIFFNGTHDYQVGDFVSISWPSDQRFEVDGYVTEAMSGTFTVEGEFEATADEYSDGGGVANRYVTALGLPFGYRDDGDVETAFLQLDFATDPSLRVYEQDWTSAQRAAVAALTRDPEDAKDSLVVPFDNDQPVFNTGLRTNASEEDEYESWQSFIPDLQRESQFVTLFSDMNADGESMNRLGYVIHGPAIYSNEFTANTIDDLSFSYAASDESDDFKVFGYLLNTADCSQTEVLDTTGAIQIWETLNVSIPSNGTYRFVFVSGTYDQNWGSGGGAVLFLDDVRLSPNAERAAAAAPTPPAALAKTGANVEWLMFGGLLALIAGSGFLAFSRRKRTA